jgi:carbamoyltransferase
MKDGELVSMVSEERFTNKKNQGGLPEHSIKWIMDSNNLTFDDIDFIGFPHIVSPIEFELVYGQHYSFRHAVFHMFNLLVPSKIAGTKKLVGPYINLNKVFRKNVLNKYSKKLGFDIAKVCQVEHHMSHGYSALYGSGFVHNGDPVLVFTMDGSGDGFSSRVAKWDGKNGYQILHEATSFHSVGELYSRVTQFLGMKVGEHEYKLMGMSPYVPEEKSEKAFRKFLEYMDFDSKGGFVNTKYYGNEMINVFRKDFAFERFDNICAGIQRHFEYVVKKWVRFWARETGIRTAVFGGGCFMNVKCNMLISEFNEFDKVFFCPSCGDESTAFGAAYRIAEEKGEKEIRPLNSLYLGSAFDGQEIEKEIMRHEDVLEWERCSDIEKRVAELLRDGNIIGRFKGPAEWGARALGGRSILCRADNLKIIHKLNKSIKSRDFWMPFAASIIEDDADMYIINLKKIPSPYMNLSFNTTEKAQNDIAAGIHPFDHTCRPQFVSRETSPDYYRLLKEFKELTGLSGLLNTSFNLHGYPIVGSPEIAIRTLLDSRLDYVAIESFLVRRKNGHG